LTLEHWKRAVAVAGIALIGVGAAAPPLLAEGGEGPSLVTGPPHRDGAEPVAPAPEASAEPGREQSSATADKVAVRTAKAAEPAQPAGLKALIQRYSAQNAVPYGLADAIIRIESRYNAGARNGPHMGLTQIHTATARSLGYAGEAAGLLDAETNIRYGLKYIATAYRLAGGDTCGTILRYQAGHGPGP
jgi:soluble lytic murein transglycosylase-like protein